MTSAVIVIAGWAGMVEFRQDDTYICQVDDMEYSHMVELLKLTNTKSARIIATVDIDTKGNFWGDVVTFFTQNNPTNITYTFE